MIYAILRWLVRIIVRTFYRKVEIHGIERIPATGPLIFASNHPNMIMDPFMVMVANDREVHFLAKSTLFSMPLFGWLIRIGGVIPVYRKQDDPTRMDQNKDMFAACHRVLEDGGVLGIFPEGVSETGPRLRPLKTGTARIVLEAEVKNGFGLGVRIVPVGLNFEEGHLFRSDVLVQIGEPITAADLEEPYRKDPREAVTALTDRIEANLELLTRNLEEAQDAQFVRKLERIYHEGYLGHDPSEPHPDLRTKFQVDTRIRNAHRYYLEQDPDRVTLAQRLIERYLATVERLGLTDQSVGRYHGIATALRESASRLPLLLLGTPVLGYGFLTNYPPYWLVGFLTRRTSTDPVELATNKVGFSLASFPLYYLALLLLIGTGRGGVVALAALPTFPLAGLLGLAFLDRIRPLMNSWYATALFLSRRTLAARLKVEREKILMELESLREGYLSRFPEESLTPSAGRP